MSGEWNSVVGMDHMSPAHSQESDLRNNLPNLDISKTLFELLENVFCKQVFMSPAQSPESDFRKKISKS